MLLDNLLTSVIYLLVCLGLFALGHIVFRLCRKGYNFHHELVEEDNAALALVVSGYYLGLIFSIGGVIVGPSAGLLEDLADLLVYGLLGIVLLNVSAWINDRFILSKFKIRKEILDDQNSGTGVVEFAVFVASGLNIFGAVYGTGGSIYTTFVFWAVGQCVLVLIGHYYNLITRYDIHEHIEKDNVAVGVGFAPVRRTAYIVHSDFMTKFNRGRIASVLSANSNFELWLDFSSFINGHFNELTNAIDVDCREWVFLQNFDLLSVNCYLFFFICVYKFSGIIA